MAAFALTGSSGGSFVETKLVPGDIILQNESVTVVSSVTGTTLSASNLLGGIISRQGAAVAGFTDTFDSAANILYQLSGNNTGSQPVVDPGTSFRVRILNTTGYTQTFSLGAGLLQGVGTFFNNGATWYEYLFTVQAICLGNTYVAATVSGSNVINFVFPVGQVSQPLMPAGEGVTFAQNALVTGTGIPANAQIRGLVHGQGGIIGLTLSANATVTAPAQLITVSSCIKLDEIGGGPN